MNIDSYESLTSESDDCEWRDALAIHVAHVPTFEYGDEELEVFHVKLEKVYRGNRTFYKVIVGDLTTWSGTNKMQKFLSS